MLFVSLIIAQNATDVEDISSDTIQALESNSGLSEAETALFKWLSKNIKYPEEAKKNKIQGKVIVRVFIEKDGTCTNIQLLRGVNELLDNEAIRVLKSYPNIVSLKQHSQRGKYLTLPIVFNLEGLE